MTFFIYAVFLAEISISSGRYNGATQYLNPNCRTNSTVSFSSEMEELDDYFRVHFKVLKFIGIPLEPMTTTNIVCKTLYCFYAVLFVGLFPVYFALSEFLQLFNESNIDTFTFNLSYAITHCLGKQTFFVKCSGAN